MQWVERFRKEGAAADLDELGIEVDDDLNHLEPEEAEQLASKLKPIQKRKFLALYGGDEPEPAADEEEGEKKEKAFDRTEFKWTITNRKPKNLPQLFHGMKGINTLHEVKEAIQFGGIASDQVSKCLDDFCGRVQDSDNADKNIY